MDINTFQVFRSKKRKHDTKAHQFRQIATVHPYHMNIDVGTVPYPNQPKLEENNRPRWPVTDTVYYTSSLPKRLPSASSTRPNGNSSSSNEQVNRCRCLNNEQRMPHNERPEANSENSANNATNVQIPIIFLDDDPAPNNNSTVDAERTNRSNNGADGETAQQEVAENENRERTGREDAEDAFGRSIALMLKKIRNISDRLKIQAKIYETLSQQLKQR